MSDNTLASLLVLIVILAGISGGIGMAIGEDKDRPWQGFFLGFLYGPLGLIVISLLGSPAYEDDNQEEEG